MHDNAWTGFWGMHGLWWLFWLGVTVMFLVLLVRAAGRAQSSTETPLELLQRRFAAGEIDTQEYEQRKATLERDAQPNTRRSGS